MSINSKKVQSVELESIKSASSNKLFMSIILLDSLHLAFFRRRLNLILISHRTLDFFVHNHF